MVNEGIVLGHKISERGIEVDKPKVDAIEKIPCPKDIKGIHSFLGHDGFYRRFIKDFSKISRPLTSLLEKDIPFVFDDDCLEAFETLKKTLISKPTHFCFLDGYSGFSQILLSAKDQSKTTFTCPFGTFAFRCMPFGLCNAPATFQRCMTTIFSDFCENIVEVLMDDFLFMGSLLMIV